MRCTSTDRSGRGSVTSGLPPPPFCIRCTPLSHSSLPLLSARHETKRRFSFNLTYVCHLYAFHPLFADWMLNSAFLGPNVAPRDAPFHLVLTSLGLHDVAKETPHQFEDALRTPPTLTPPPCLASELPAFRVSGFG